MDQRKTVGFTLIETITVVAIILIVVAVSFPVFLSAKKKTGEVVTINNLRQLYVALEIYRTDYDGQGVYGHHAAMGLPNAWDASNEGWGFNVTSLQVLYSGCMSHPSFGPEFSGRKGGISYNVYDDEKLDDHPFEYYALKQESSLVVFQDDHCADPKIDIFDDASPKTLIGITISGSIRKETHTGIPFYLSWWE